MTLHLLSILVSWIAIAYGHDFFHDTQIYAAGVQGEIVLLVLLPPLLFESAFGINFHDFKRTIFGAFILAGKSFNSLFSHFHLNE